MLTHPPSHTRAVFQSLLVTLLWSTSFVLIKIGLDDIPALTFAGLRYALATACLVPFVWRSGQFALVKTFSRADWRRLIVQGAVYYGITQGSQFLALERLPAVTISLLLSFTSALVALLAIGLLNEVPTRTQWSGIGLYLIGAGIYFFPIAIPARELIGLLFALAGLVSNSYATVLGRAINRAHTIPPMLVTVISMSIGATLLLTSGVALQGLPAFGLQGWAIVLLLASLNTAFAFTLWNHTQRTLSAVETSVINNTMLIQIAVLAWLFLGESLTLREIGGLALAAVGTLVVQLARRG